MSETLYINDLTYVFKGSLTQKKAVAVKDLSLEISPGEAFGFLGANGAGKTTTIKCILGLLTPSKGEILYGKKKSSSLSVRAQMGYLPEQPYFYDHLTVYELLDLYSILSKVSDKKKKIQEVLAKVGMEERAFFKLRALSKGLTQRVALAQALLTTPQLLILDEPFSGLDPIGRREFRDLFFDLKKQGVTLFISSHVLSDIENLCDRASISTKGEMKKIIHLKNKDALQLQHIEIVIKGENLPDHATLLEGGRARFRFSNFHEANNSLEEFLRNKYEIIEFTPHYQSLESIFVDEVKR